MPYYINADHVADYFAALRRNLPHDSKDFLTRDSMLLTIEQLIRFAAGCRLFRGTASRSASATAANGATAIKNARAAGEIAA